MNNQNLLNNKETHDSRQNLQHNQQTEQQSANTPPKNPWYNQGWVWMIITTVGIVVLFVALSGITDQLGNVNESIQDQTEAVKDQNQILGSIKEEIDQLITTVKDSVSRLIQNA